jgi:hypothetical protein
LAAISSSSPQDVPTTRGSVAARLDVQRRRRELALTTRWLRELRGTGTDATRPAARFTRPTEQ